MSVFTEPGLGVAPDKTINFGRLFRRDSNQRPIISAEVPSGEIGNRGVVTDQSLLQDYFRQFYRKTVYPISTDKFLDKSRDEYNPPWLTREIVQNFVDHNAQNRGTLDGVRIKKEALSQGQTRFIIEGDWPFDDPTGLLTLHSDKPEGVNTAGGNGIGLKQTVLRFFRDFGVKKFIVKGNGWEIDYQLAKAAEINADWAKRSSSCPMYQIRHDWLLAEAKETEQSQKCSYVIETDNPDVIAALEQMPTLGVSKENPFLQDVDYENEHGAIKWMKGDLGSTRGRLFINGQVMNYGHKGATADTYWVGPENLSIRLNNLRYNMSVDRPPLNRYELRNYLSDMVQAMSKEELIAQIRKSEYIWSHYLEVPEDAASLVLIDSMASWLPYRRYDKSEYASLFGDKKYIVWDRGVSKAQIGDLEKQGYSICPSSLEALGIPLASSKLSSVEAASNATPNAFESQRMIAKVAEDCGLPVYYEDLSDVKDLTALMGRVNERLGANIVSTTVLDGRPGTVRINLNTNIPKELLSHPLAKPSKKDVNQQLLYFIRGLVYQGLSERLFEKIFLKSGEFVTTFDLQYDTTTLENNLLARVVRGGGEGNFLEIECRPEAAKLIQDIFSKKAKTSEDISEEAESAKPASTTNVIEIGERKGGRMYGEITKSPELPPLAQVLREIPVTQPVVPKVEIPNRTIVKKTEVDIAVVTEMEKKLPGLRDAVAKLEEVSSKSKTQVQTGDQQIRAYVDWRKSDNFYGRATDDAGYLSGRHLVEILAEQNQADIASVEKETPENATVKEYNRLNKRLERLGNSLRPKDEEVDEFEIILTPTEKQLAKLRLLRTYLGLTTGVGIPNDLFVYRGTGSRGINIASKAIGIHEALLDVEFNEAEGTASHELAHNQFHDHKIGFIKMLQALSNTAKARLHSVIEKTERGEQLTAEDLVLTDIRQVWNTLRVKND